MIKCICVNDKDRPSKIPPHKWVEKGKEYTIMFAQFIRPQRQLAVQLIEINLDESCAPFEYFLAKRFAIRKKDLEDLHQLIYDSYHIRESIEELTKQIEITSNNTI
jgi:hypothetical protein